MVQFKDVMDAYDIKYAEEGFKNNESYYRWALDTLNPPSGSRLLDIACGLGDLLYHTRERDIDSVGIDLSPVAAAQAHQRAPQAGVLVGNAQQLPFAEQSFDYITILGSLEHLLDPGEGLLEMRRVLKWGGKVLIVVPNAYYLPDIIWQVWRTGYGPNHKQVVERFAPAQEWRGFIESGGLKVERIKKFNFQWPKGEGDWDWYRANRKRLLGLLAAPFIPFNLSHSFLYVCVKDAASKGQSFAPPPWPVPPRLVDLP